MSVTWNSTQISTEHQRQFLEAAGLAALPDISSLTDAQWKILSGIVGEETVETVRESAARPPLSNPRLPSTSNAGNWSNILMMVEEIRAKLGDAVNKATFQFAGSVRDKVAGMHLAGREAFAAGLDLMVTAFIVVEADAYARLAQSAAGEAKNTLDSANRDLESSRSNHTHAQQRLSEAQQKLQEGQILSGKGETVDLAALQAKVTAAAINLADAAQKLGRTQEKADTAAKVYGNAGKAAGAAAEAANLARAAGNSADAAVRLGEVKAKASEALGAIGKDPGTLPTDFGDVESTESYGAAFGMIREAVELINSSEIDFERTDNRLQFARLLKRISDQSGKLAETIEAVRALLLDADSMLENMTNAKDDIFRHTTM